MCDRGGGELGGGGGGGGVGGGGGGVILPWVLCTSPSNRIQQEWMLRKRMMGKLTTILGRKNWGRKGASYALFLTNQKERKGEGDRRDEGRDKTRRGSKKKSRYFWAV